MPINQKIWRYREAISFFSFNCIDNFNEYLWLKNDKLEESKEICRYYLNKWIMNNDYFYEFFKFLKPIFKELSIKCGPTFFRSLISWMDNVFIHDGQDRSDEFFWDSLLNKVINGKVHIDNELISETVSKIIEEVRNENNKIREKIRLVLSNEISDWDLKVINFIDNSRIDKDELKGIEIIENNIENIITTNNFVKVFNKNISHLDWDMLFLIHEWAKENISLIGMQKGDVCFPGSWKISYLDFEEFLKFK